MIAVAVAELLADTTDGLTFASDGTTGGNVFVDWMPDLPDRAVAVMTGAPLSQMSKLPTDLPTVQVLVRDAVGQPSQAYDLAAAIYAALDCLPAQTLDDGGPNEIRVIGCTAVQSGPVSIGRDQKDRPEFSLNFQLRVHAPTTHRPAVTTA